MNPWSRLAIALLSLTLPLFPARAAEDPFAENIRTTEPLPPDQEQKQFQLPPGFEIQLVAAEPDIAKPMNLAFDAQGRLWVTESREYPFAAAANQPGRDRIQVLSDFGPDGRARKITTFAEGLNIPIGLLPYREGVIAFSIPDIYYFADTNADGHADTKERLLGQVGARDTHGLTSAFRRGYDGWIYADHGYNNDSALIAQDGSRINLNSGNTYRFRPDGAHVEQFTWGQVNPFGLMFDPLGDLWSADCHSSPVYQLLRGAYYPSFGKPHDGLGFAPNICDHAHGSTAIAGIVFYAATNFPPSFRGNTFIGNVMTCRINRDTYVEHGSTRIAQEAPDFLRSNDPWFRPVDLQLGPDGALYIADFYNRIIGHYEVPLDHPGRDRERGRIWRIVYRGDGLVPPSPQTFDFAKAATAELLNQLANPNLTCRMLALNQIVDRIGQPAIGPVGKMLRDKKSTAEQKSLGLWILHRLGALKGETLAAAGDPDRLVRVHAMRVLSELPSVNGSLPPPYRSLVFAGLLDRDAYVQRAAADALGQHGSNREPVDSEAIQRLLKLRVRIPADDVQLLHVCRMALRNQLRSPGAFLYLETQNLSAPDAKAIAEVVLGLPGEAPASFLLKQLQSTSENRDQLLADLRHVARYAPVSELDAIPTLAQTNFPTDLETQFALFKVLQEGLAQRGGKLSPRLRDWAGTLAEQLLASASDTNTPWVSVALAEAPTVSPWFLQTRKSVDGDEASTFLCSLPPDGEKLTGTLRSRAFPIPAKLGFYLAGHDGFPDQPPGHKNLIRLLAADTSEVLASAAPPRNDLAQPVTWDLSAFAGRLGRLEIVDGDTGTAYAWLAVGRFDPLVIPLPSTNPNRQGQRLLNAAELTRTVPLPQFAARFAELFNASETPEEWRAAAARTLLALDAPVYLGVVAGSLENTNSPAALREPLALLLAEQNSPVARSAVFAALRTAPHRLQIKLALLVAGNPAGADALLTLAEQQRLSPQVLLDRGVSERLAAAKLPRLDERLAALTKGLAPASDDLQKLMDERRRGYVAARASPERGRAVFEKSCAVCHQLDGRGAVVGPQLDGVGNRGLERIIEDVLDPSRNLDPAFRPSLITLKDDTSFTGLPRRETGEVLVFVDSAGKEITVPKPEIVERRESQLSLMPANFGEALPVPEFYDLLAFLLAHGAK